MKRLKLFFACLLMAVLSIGQVWAAVVSGTAYDTKTAMPTGWTEGGSEYSTSGGGFKKLTESSYFIQTDEFCQNGFTTITIKARKFGTVTGGKEVITVEWIETGSSTPVVLGTITPTSTTLTNYSISSPTEVTGNKSGKIKISNKNASSGGGSGIQTVTISYTAGSCGSITPTCATPTFDPASGEIFSDDIDVEIACATDGVTIYYTTDGEDPTTSSDVYTTALNFTETTTLKAMAVKEGSNNSAVATATYTKMATVPGYEIDFESELAAYTDWTFVNFTKTNETITVHGGSYFAKTNATNTASITTKAKVANPGILTYYISKIGTNTNANSKWKARVSEDGTNWTIVGTEYAAASDVTAGTWKTCTADLTSYSNVFVQVYYDGTTAVRTIDDVSLTTVTPGTVATPTITGETPFVTTTTVTLACTTDGASIYYTTDGSDPSSSSTLYDDPFELNAGATVRAIAIKGSDASSIAAKEFEKVTSYSTLAEIFTKATEVGSTATDIYVTFGGWKVSAKTSNNVFLTDGTNGAVIYGSGHGFNAGDVLTGTVACKVQLYKGFTELTSLNSGSAGLTVTPGSVGDPVTKTWDQLSAVNTGALVTLENLTYDGSSLSDGENTIPTYTTFYTATFEAGKSYNLTGVYQYYDTDGQILPRSAADVEEIIETFTVTYNNAPENGTLTIKNGDEVVTTGASVNEGTVLTIVTTPAEGYKLAGVTVNGSAYAESTLTLTDDVTIAASFEENLADPVNSYVLSEIGTETPQSVSGLRVGDKVNLPLTATSCSKTFRGWSENASCASAPEYAPGAQYTLKADNKLYAVYATATPGAVTNYPIDFENETTDYTDWSFDNMTSQGTNSGVTAHGGSYFGTTGGKATASVTTTAKIANPSSITFYVSKQSTNTTASNWKVEVSADGSDWTQVGDAQSATSMSKGEWVEVTRDLSAHSDVYVRVYYGSNTAVRCIDDLVLSAQGPDSYSDYSTDCQAQVKTPTFSPAAGTYTAVQTVEISTETEDATIYYTTNGDVPTTSSTLYEGAIEVAESKTIKAIAVKDGMANSAVATAAYTINLPLSTMDQIFAAATAAGSTATDANIQFNNWVVSGVSTNGKNVFVTDGTKGFIIFDNGGEMGFAVGNVLSGTAACKVQLYNGAAELTTLSSTTEGLNVATGGIVTPEVKAISALSGINTGAAVTINSVQFDGEYLSDGANEIKPYNSLFAYDALENGKYYNVTGIYQQFGNTTKEILPRSAADIEEVSLSDPEISYTPASATIELGEELPGTVFANPHELAISYTSDNEAVATVSNTGVIALGTETGTAVITASFAGNATYAPANVTYTITVNPASVSENVVILAVYNEKYYAMSTTIPSEAFTAIEVEYDGSKVTVNSEAEKTAIQWTKKTSGDNTTFQTKDEDKKYMKGTSSGAAMSLNANVCNWSWDGTNEYYYIGSRTFLYQNGVGFKNYATTNIGKSGYSGKAQVIAIAPENIVITSKVSAELAYDPESDEITEGDAWSAPSLVNPHSVTITSYATDNDAVATVTDGGVIALAGGIGTAHITAHFDGDASYLEGDAVYTITVNAVPEPADVCDGTDDFLDTEDKGNPTSYTNRSTPNGWSADNAGYKVIEEKAYWMINGKTTAVGVITSPELTGGLGTLKFRYANTNSESNGVSVKIEIKQGGDVVKEYTLTKANSEVVQNTVYTETIENINVAGNFQIVITNLSPSNNTGNKDRVSIGRFCWTGYTAPEPPTPSYGSYNRDGLTPGNYGTICLPKAGTIEGATLFEIANYENEVIYMDEIISGELEAGRPYIFQADANATEIVVNYTSADVEETAGHANGLYGFYNLENENATLPLADDASLGNYILYQNAYWLVSGRAAYIANFRAYIKLSQINNTGAQAPGRRRVAMVVNGAQNATGMDELNASEAPVKMIIDGQLYILRGEKMFNANGQLVK